MHNGAKTFVKFMDYGRPMKPFFIKIPNFWAWADKCWGIWGYFCPIYQHPFWYVLWVPCPCFPLNNHYFYQKLSLYIQIPNIYMRLGLGLWFEYQFGQQRIRDLAIVCLFMLQMILTSQPMAFCKFLWNNVPILWFLMTCTTLESNEIW